MLFSPQHKGIKDNETVDALAKIATKKAKTIEPTYNITKSDLKIENSKFTHEKWQKEDGRIHPTIYKSIYKNLKQKLSNLKLTS